MQKKRFTWWMSTALVALLFALTGCQAVQGLDIAQAIQNSASMTSAASKGSLQLELVTNPKNTLSAEEKVLFNALKDVKVAINNAAMQDAQHLSADGALTYSKGSIPFKLNMDGTKLILKVEGAPKPIVFDPFTNSTQKAAGILPKEIQSQLGTKVAEIQPALTKFLLANAANPKNMTVTSVTEPVNNESLSLQKAHVELSGSDLADLLKGLLKNILADEAGLKDLISQLYDVLQPLINEQEGTGVASLIKNKSLAVGFVYSAIHQYLEDAAASLDQMAQSTSPLSIAGIQTKSLLYSQSALKVDLFIDADKQIRKEQYELSLPVTDAKSGIAAFKVTYVCETWNINKPVKADAIDVSGGVLNLGAELSSIYNLLNQLEKGSPVYKFLKDDLKVTKKEIHLQLQNSGSESSEAPQPFINADNTTMVPVRFISEQLGAEVKWNGELKQVTIADALSGTTIVLTLGSQAATVNGTSEQLESAAALHNGSTFVPIRFIAENLGSKVGFDDATRTVTIKRD
ncbi:copper amine oxidase N-terminal domain-containing protein [Paenibacillus sp. SI8]|uniref:copper amine oxidase N-terminal domain-containing protein n=1 Tax=unclassified Paenibacillus TaxID=185978 RepID=UPI003466D7DD